MLVLDGVYLRGTSPPLFRPVEPPSQAELQTLLERIASRIGEKLEQQGLIVRDCENAYLALDPAGSVPMHDLTHLPAREAVGEAPADILRLGFGSTRPIQPT